MIPNIVGGPPLGGATDLKSQASEKMQGKDLKISGKDSFGKALEEKISASSSKEAPPKPERREDSTTSRSDKNDKAEAKTDKKVVAKSERPEKIEEKPDRQKAIKEFMDSFESEFDIPPTRLVEAMANLEDSELTQSPEETAEAVIAQLDLGEEDQEKAQAMYAGLLMQLQKADIAQATPAASVLANQNLQAGLNPADSKLRLAASQARQDGMEASVDRLNQQFWAQKTAMPTSVQQQQGMESLNGDLLERMGMAGANTEELATASQQPIIPMNAQKLPELPPHLQGQMSESISPQLLAALAAKQAAAQSAASGETAELSEEDQELLAQTDSSPDMFQQLKNEKPNMQMMAGGLAAHEGMTQEDAQSQSQSQSQMQGQQQFTGTDKASGKEEVKSKLTAKAAEFKTSLLGAEGMAVQPKLEALKAEMGMPVVAATPSPVANAEDHEAAVKQLMNQAQILIKKGGGEMKVQMTPEGMGTIHLKMQIQDGKVNMQMQADTAEAKKTIESGLAELKTSLAAHKLSVDHIKVDTVSGPNTEMTAQNQNNMSGNSQRDSTRQFWNQFHEGSQGRQNSFVTDGMNLRGYGQSQRDPLQPVEASSVRPRAVTGKGNGLNLVA